MGKTNQRQMNRMAGLFATLSDPARLGILHCLRSGPRSVGEIQRTCRLKQANTSKHLRVLREAGLVSPQREGTTVRYAISEPLIFGLCDLACGKKTTQQKAILIMNTSNNSMRYIVETTKTPEAAVEDLRTAVAKHGFGVLHAYDLKETLTAKGFPLPHACHILEVCNPQQASKVLAEDMGMNIALPCRISVYEEGGKTKIATALPTKLLSALSNSPALAAAASEVEEKMKAMMNEAV